MQHKQPEPGVPGEQIPLKRLLTFNGTRPNIWLRKESHAPAGTPLCLHAAPEPPLQRPGFPPFWHPKYGPFRTASNILPRYLAYQLQAPALVRWRETVVVGTRNSWWDALGTQKIFVPSLEDQQKAIDTLSRLDEKVTKLRENYRRTEQLLKELQESVLVRAVYCLPMGGEVKV